ncbi:MAG TPA: hypothetical protein VHL11_08885, partial [Phototrophicaceae bacterium]|nr:hypothetical protein [Phototrophicaceae bacterium]
MPDIIANRYQVIDRIGQGGMGVVYRAADRLTGDTIALKQVTTPEAQLRFASMGKHDDFRLALAQEFKVLASLRHPHIVSVLDYGFDADRSPFFTMEYLENAQTLLDYSEGLSSFAKIQLLVQIL